MKYVFYIIAGVVAVLFIMSIVSAILMVIQFMVYVGIVYAVGWLIYKIAHYLKDNKPPE